MVQNSQRADENLKKLKKAMQSTVNHVLYQVSLWEHFTFKPQHQLKHKVILQESQDFRALWITIATTNLKPILNQALQWRPEKGKCILISRQKWMLALVSIIQISTQSLRHMNELGKRLEGRMKYSQETKECAPQQSSTSPKVLHHWHSAQFSYLL